MGYFVQQNCVEGRVGREKEALFFVFKLEKAVNKGMCHAKTKMDSPDVKPFKNRIATKTTATGGTVSIEISNWLAVAEPVG
ncbi:unnamed protein product [Musa acuminata subsp. burmannicoides]